MDSPEESTPPGPLLGVGLPTVLAAIPILVFPRASILALFSDDAFYYFEIARNIVGGAGSTFDGIVPTNGYHPLWMVFMVAVYGIAGSATLAPLVFVAILSVFLAVVVLYWNYRLVERFIAPRLGLLAVAACLLPNLLTGMLNGMETGILLVTATLLVGSSYRWGLGAADTGALRSFAYGLILGVLFLCRLDTAFVFLGAFGLKALVCLLSRCPWRSALAGLFCLGSGFTLLTIPYFAWNWSSFGHLSPISGAVKSQLPEIRGDLALGTDDFFALLLLLGFFACLGVSLALDRRQGAPLARILASPLWVLFAGSVIHFLHVFLFMTWGVYWWHFVLYGYGGILAFARVAHQVHSLRPAWSRRWVPVTAALLFGLAVVGQVWIASKKLEHHRAWLEGAEWARVNTEPEVIFALKDAGLFGYFSQRSVVNLDGKANGYEYQEYLAEDDLDGYLDKVGVRFVADIGAAYENDVAIISIPRGAHGWLRYPLRREWEVYRSQRLTAAIRGSNPRLERSFVIWRLPPRSERPPR